MFIQRPDAQLHAQSFGQGPLTLLAIGGWTAGGEIWHSVFGHLPHWRCVSLDHRGAGASLNQGPITVDAMADDLLAVADAMHLGRCVVASESSGAAAALRAIERAPGRFVGQVLVGAAWGRTEPGAADPLVAGLQRDYPGTLRWFIDNCCPETDSVALRHWALQMMMRSRVEDAVALLRSREQIAPADATPGHALPALLVHGDQDRIVPVQSSRDLAARLPRAELHILQGLGHVPLCTEPAAVAALIDDFSGRMALAA